MPHSRFPFSTKSSRHRRQDWSTLPLDSAPPSPTISEPARARLQKKDRASENGSARASPIPRLHPSPLPSPMIEAAINPFSDVEGTFQMRSSESTTLRPSSEHTESFGIRTSESTTLGQPSLHAESYHVPKPWNNSKYASSSDSLSLDNSGLTTGKQSKVPPTARLHRALLACKNKVFKHVDPETIWSIIDIREIFWPFSWKKYAVLAMVGGLVAAVVVTEFMYHWIQSSMAITRRNMLPVLVIVIGLEPCMMVLILLIAKIPDISQEDASPSNPAPNADLAGQMSALEKQVSKDQDPHSTALVIPCHNSDHVAMKRVLDSAYPHFRPQDIFIIDNGRSQHPNNNTFREFIHSQNPQINYIWSPIGSKNAAQLVGAMAARNHEYIMTVDDDVCIPANFRAPTDLIDEKTKGVAFPLKATDASGKRSLFLVSWQDCEYRMAGLTKLAESRICGVLFPHGAGWFCERETLIDLISNYHSIDFIAEDVNTGLSMQKMKKMIAFDARCILETEVPTTIFGQGLNWYKQRVRSWEMGRHGRLFAFADRLFLSLNGQTTPWGIFAQKFIHFYSIACIVVDWVRVPVLVTMGTNAAYWRQAGPLTFASVLPLMYFKYISCRRRPDLEPGFWGSLTYPVYKQLYSLVSIIGAVRSVVFYIGGHQMPMTIKEMVKKGDKQAFWLDERFEMNPGFLADEGVALRAAEAMKEGKEEYEKMGIHPSIIEMPSPTLDGMLRPPMYSSPAMSYSSLDCIAPVQPRGF